MERKSDNETHTNCENCGRELFGRIDKRFCNDNCRNEFNRKKKQQEIQKANESMPEILKIIKRNYEILLSFGAIEEGSEIFIPKETLLKKGFNFRFFTSIDERKKYFYCFERGWREVFESIYIRDDLTQIKF